MKLGLYFALAVLCFLGKAKATAYSKVLVAYGWNGLIEFPPNDVEVIDLLSSETTCQKLANTPFGNIYARGGLGFDEKPVLCGGIFDTTCRVYEDGAWKKSDAMNEPKMWYAMSRSPFQDGKLFLTGGIALPEYLGSTSTSLLTETGWQESITLPVAMDSHCMVAINSTTVIVIGGYRGTLMTSGSSFFNTETNTWTEGPQMQQQRIGHSCGLIRKNSDSQEMSVIAAGGWDGYLHFSSVEVLDLGSDEWRSLPDLPLELTFSEIVEDPSGGAVIIGGMDGDFVVHDTLYKLPHAGPDATWELMPQKLQSPRGLHTAFLIPDEIAACN